MLKKISYQYKIFIVYSLFIMAMVSLFASLIYVYVSDNLRQNARSNIIQLTDKVGEQLDMVLNEMDRISIGMVSNRQVMEILSNIPSDNYEMNYFDNHPSYLSFIKDAIIAANGSLFRDKRIAIISKEFDFLDVNVSSENKVPSKNYIKGIKWVQEAFENSESKFILDSHKDDWSLDE